MKKKIFTVFISIFLSLNFVLAQTNSVDTYQNVSSGLDGSSTTTEISNTSTAGLRDTAQYVGTMAAAAILTLIIFKFIEGAVLKGTYDNIFDQQKGNTIIKNAATTLLIFIFVNLLFTYIDPDYGSWIFGVSTGVPPSAINGGNCSPVNPKLTAYSPQSSNKNGNSGVEGSINSSITGLDGKSLVRTLEDVRNGKSSYVTLAGDSVTYKTKYTIPTITYVNAAGQTYTLKNITGYVHDTGSAFKGAGYDHFDVAVDLNMTTSALNKEPYPFGANSITLTPQDCTPTNSYDKQNSLANKSNSDRCVKPVNQNDLVQVGTRAAGTCVPAGPIYLRKDVAEKFKQMQQAAQKDGVTLTPTTGYRSDDVQLCLWKQNGQDSSKAAKPCIAGGNGSNHLEGTAVDISMGCTTGNTSSQCNQKIYNWLKSNAANYGFYNNLNTDPVHWSLSGN